MNIGNHVTERSADAVAALTDALSRPRRITPGEMELAWLASGRRSDAVHRGQRLALWQWGDGHRVLLVHGWDSHAGHLAPLGHALLAAGFGVVAFDNPAHGISEGARTSVVDIGDAISSVVAAIGPVEALLAHSVGSPAALRAFARGLHVRASVHIAGPASLLRVMQGYAAAAGLPADAFDAFRQRFEAEIGVPVEAMELAQLAGGFRHPALLLHDPADREIPFAESEALHRAWSGSLLLALPEVGHRRILGSAAAIAAATKFLREQLQP